LSNDIRSKQFIKIFRTEDGEYESMVQRVFRQIRKIDADAKVTIATSRSQISAIHNQLGTDVGISLEPCRRDTFPAIALATAYLHDVQGGGEEEAVVVCPVDPYVNDDYFQALDELGHLAETSDANLVLMGIEPTYPSEKYGYIIPAGKDKVSPVSTFKEKPDVETAKDYIRQGALWNGGVFAYKLKYVLEKAHELIDFTDYQDLFEKYETLKKISFDYAVVEQEKKIQVMRFAGEWKDLGTWNTLTEAMEEATVGQGMMNENCENVHLINELSVPVLCMGLKDVVVAASPEGILVSDKEQSSYIKPYVDQIDQQIMFAEKSWGSFRVLDVEEESMTIKVTLNPGHQMNYHSHERRDEVWTIISGEGQAIVDGKQTNVTSGDVIRMPAGSRHTLIAETELKAIEVQTGKEISVHDKKKYEL
jgi:mannose-1-phosphate guanylyltransferase